MSQLMRSRAASNGCHSAVAVAGDRGGQLGSVLWAAGWVGQSDGNNNKQNMNGKANVTKI